MQASQLDSRGYDVTYVIRLCCIEEIFRISQVWPKFDMPFDLKVHTFYSTFWRSYLKIKFQYLATSEINLVHTSSPLSALEVLLLCHVALKGIHLLNLFLSSNIDFLLSVILFTTLVLFCGILLKKIWIFFIGNFNFSSSFTHNTWLLQIGI